MAKGELIIKGRFEWFSEKDDLNIKNHGFSFEKILSVFDDPFFYEIYDVKHSDKTQDRYFGIGCTDDFFVVQVSYTEDDRIHIISARYATAKERQGYYDRLRKLNSEV